MFSVELGSPEVAWGFRPGWRFIGVISSLSGFDSAVPSGMPSFNGSSSEDKTQAQTYRVFNTKKTPADQQGTVLHSLAAHECVRNAMQFRLTKDFLCITPPNLCIHPPRKNDRQRKRWGVTTDTFWEPELDGEPRKQVRLVSAKAERPNHPSQGGGGPPRQRRRRDSIRPIRLTVALGLNMPFRCRPDGMAFTHRQAKHSKTGTHCRLFRRIYTAASKSSPFPSEVWQLGCAEIFQLFCSKVKECVGKLLLCL